MRYLSSFRFSENNVKCPNIYPYNVFAKKREKVLVFEPITVLYGNNASGKSTVLNVIANKLQLNGFEYATCNKYGSVRYFERYVYECAFSLGEDEQGLPFFKIPDRSRYIKSEDILYEIKKIQQEQVLRDG